MRTLISLVLVAGVVASATAQDRGTPIEPDDWREIAAGRTLTYTVNGEFFALERYPNSGDAVSIQMSDGRCMAGHWTYQDQNYCFFWEGHEPVCFLHERQGDEILVTQVVDGELTGAVQIMANISDAPLQCGALTS